MSVAHETLVMSPVPPVQRSLRVGAVDDPLEVEADAVADQVMRMPSPVVQRCPGGCPGDEELRRSPVDRSAGTGLLDAGTATRIGAARGGGSALPGSVRSFFEPRFGADFSGVRVHADGAAAELATGVNARAFTVGRDVFFGAGEFRPGSSSGKRLLAHELTHTLQQGAVATVRRTTNPPPEITAPPEDLDCDVADDVPQATHTFKFVRDSAALLDEDQERLARIAAAWHQTTDFADIRIDGFASAEGTPLHNWHLSCARARAIEQALLYPSGGGDPVYSSYIEMVAAHGETDAFSDDLAANRVGTVTVTGTPTSEEPEPEVPEPEPEPQGCTTFEEWLGHDVAVLLGEVVDCVCLPLKAIDLFDDVISKAPLVGQAVGNDAVQAVISWADFLCGVFDFAQLAWELGREPGPCWEWANLSGEDYARLTAMAVAIGADLGAGWAAGLLTEWIAEAVAETAAAVFIEGGPVTSAAGAALGFVVGSIIERYAQQVLELFFDVGAEIAQNYITYGTPFPLDACRACLALAARVSASIDVTLCDRWNEAIPEQLRIPEWHGALEGATP